MRRRPRRLHGYSSRLRARLQPYVSTSRIRARDIAELRVAHASHYAVHMKTIDDTTLATVSGGMRWEDLPRSENVEDRRDWTPDQHRRVRPQSLPPPDIGPRTPGDLPSQIGLDDLERLGRGRR